METKALGKLFILAALIFLILGLIFYFAGKIPHFSKIPGDIVIRKKNFSFYFPLGTSLLLSLLLTMILWFLREK